MKFTHKCYLALVALFILYCFLFLSFENGVAFLLTFWWVIFFYCMTLKLVGIFLGRATKNMQKNLKKRQRK